MINNKHLAKAIIKAKLLDKKDVKHHLEQAEAQEVSLYNLLLEEKAITKEALNPVIAKYYDVNLIDLAKTNIDVEILKIIPEVVAQKHQAVSFAKDQNGLHIATCNIDDKEFFEHLKKKNGQNIIVYFTDPDSIRMSIKKYHQNENEEFGSLIQNVIDHYQSNNENSLPVIKIVNRLLKLAYSNKSSDIHIEPYEENVLVRFRIDGMLHDIAEIPLKLQELIATRIKILSRLRTDEHRAAQDGKLKFDCDNKKIDVRVSIVPVVHGEKIVMRLMSEKSRQYDIETLGFRKEDLKIIKENIKRPWGMTLATGPTGSGKTTTLYSILKKLNKREVNISTIEDPVEYDMDGINQIQVNKKTDLTFSTGLRAIVRQDPDIIMVGEIRDEETAKIAINSAMTGHLVLSTLHTNDAGTTLPRLIDMGIQPFLVSSTINIVVAQRLVRKICPKCGYKTTLNEEILKLLKKELSDELIKKYKLDDPNTQFTYGKGCDACNKTGYQGRLGIYEILQMNDEIKKLIMENANASTVQKKAIEMGMLPMIEDGILKVIDGLTTIDEIIRETQE
ncbi:type II/IV secretion system protein [Candidatus Falkowbacteria bacterium]|nr:type II/IV secretion system protein [Candidatus Falkowbacteria bacterium]